MPRRVVFAVLAALIFLSLAFALYPQGDTDLIAVLKDMRNTLKEFNTRLAQVEQLVKELPKKESKSASKGQKASAQPSPETIPASTMAMAQDAYQRGHAAEDRGSYDHAIVEYSNAVQLDPHNDAAFLHRAYAYFYAGRLDLALADVNQSLSIQPNNSQAYEFRSRVYRGLRDYPHALADLNEALKRDYNPNLLLAQAGIEEERGNLKTAIDIYGATLVRQPNSSVALLKRARAYEQLKQTDRALADCTAAIAAHPDLAEAYVCRADAHVRMTLLPAAIADLNTALKLNPSSVEASRMIAAVRDLVALNDGSKPEQAPPSPPPVVAGPFPAPPATAVAPPPSAPATAIAAPTPIAPATLAVAQSANTEPSPDAMKVKQFRHLMYVGRQKLAEGKFEDAILDLTQAIQLDPSSALAYNSRGYAELRTLKYQDALKDFTTAIQLNPDYANAHLNLGATLQLLGEKGGREHMQKAAELEKAASASALVRKP